MSANVYTIEDLLVGKFYRSRTIEGEIVEAEKDNRAVWYGDNLEPYLVRVRGNGANYQYRTIAVKVGE
jgi:hypothetical protein